MWRPENGTNRHPHATTTTKPTPNHNQERVCPTLDGHTTQRRTSGTGHPGTSHTPAPLRSPPDPPLRRHMWRPENGTNPHPQATTTTKLTPNHNQERVCPTLDGHTTQRRPPNAEHRAPATQRRPPNDRWAPTWPGWLDGPRSGWQGVPDPACLACRSLVVFAQRRKTRQDGADSELGCCRDKARPAVIGWPGRPHCDPHKAAQSVVILWVVSVKKNRWTGNL